MKFGIEIDYSLEYHMDFYPNFMFPWDWLSTNYRAKPLAKLIFNSKQANCSTSSREAAIKHATQHTDIQFIINRIPLRDPDVLL